MNPKRGIGVAVGVVPIAAFTFLPVGAWTQNLLEWIRERGAWGYAAFVAFYVLACALFIIPGSLATMTAGVLFGVLAGTLTVSTASTRGARAAFLLGRHLARDWIARKIEGNVRFRAIDEAVARADGKIVLLTHLSPIFPFSLLNRAYGLTRISFRSYALASWIGMLPGTVLYVYLGALAGDLVTLASEEWKRTNVEWIFLAVGLRATAAVTVFVSRIASKALARAVPTRPAVEGGHVV